LGKDYLTHLNYAITLYTNDEIEKAREQYLKFEAIFLENPDTSDVDPDILKQGELLRKALV
jgi:Bardet-Biedl syndrome 4 protein